MKNITRRAMLAGTTAAAIGTGFRPKAATAADASLLKTSLTPFGAERAGNAEGSIPAWTGGYLTVPAGYVSGQPRPDPFAQDKVLFSITAQNVAQYADKLPQGVIEMMKLYPSYRVDVYPTRRSHALPQYVYDNIALNVTRAQLSADGTAVTGAFGGVPFPIPANGAAVMWNHLTAFQGEALKVLNSNYVVTGSGQKYLASLTTVTPGSTSSSSWPHWPRRIRPVWASCRSSSWTPNRTRRRPCNTCPASAGCARRQTSPTTIPTCWPAASAISTRISSMTGGSTSMISSWPASGRCSSPTTTTAVF
jgi:hypothetical protein